MNCLRGCALLYGSQTILMDVSGVHISQSLPHGLESLHSVMQASAVVQPTEFTNVIKLILTVIISTRAAGTELDHLRTDIVGTFP